MRRTGLGLALLLLVGVGCTRDDGDDDTAQPGDDDDAGDDDAGDDDDFAGDDDDDDTEFAPCDDDTAAGTWIAAYEGTAQLEVEQVGGSSWSLTCDTQATMARHAHSFLGQIDCGDPSFAAVPLTLEGQKSGNGSCIDGELLGEIVELGEVAWPWIGSIDTQDVTGYVTGGIHVTLYGAGFTAAEDMTVLFGDQPATPTDQCGGSGECEVAIPAAAVAGPVDVILTNSNGTATLPGGFTYLGS